MSIDKKFELEEADKTQLEMAVKHSLSSRTLAKQRYILYLGRQFGQHRNQFWLEPDNGNQDPKYAIDYFHNLNHMGGNLLTVLNFLMHSHLAKDKEIAEYIAKNIQFFNKYLGENLLMCELKNIDLKGKSLNVPNKEIIKDLTALKANLSASKMHEFGTPEYIDKFKKFMEFYTPLSEKYRKYNDKLPKY